MRGRYGGVPMHERVTRGRSADPTPEDPGPGRHCWVAGGVGDDGLKRPGLLAEWRQAGAGWEGRVVYVGLAGPGRWVLVEEWLPADRLTPA